MTLSPVAAILDMITPVVLITVATVFANGLMIAAGAVANRVYVLNHARLGILTGPDGEILDEGDLPPMNRERLAQIRDEVPLIMRRFERIRNSVLLIWIAIGLLVLSVVAIAVAVTASSEAFGFTALALVIAGVAGVFAGIVGAIGPLARSANALIDETTRTRLLG
jgi:hypothetical protein